MMSTATELDPTILKALGFFRSNSIDSSVQLKAMLNDAILHSKSTDAKGFSHHEKSLSTASKLIKVSGNDLKKRDGLSQKRQYDKLHDSDGFNSAKKPLLHPLAVGSSIKETSNNLLPNGAFNKSSPIPMSTISTDDFDLEMEMAELVCAVCKEMAVGLRNKLVECQECHNLYHQDCHIPPVTDKDMNDPRRVWYCVKCKQKMKQENNNIQTTVPPTTAVPIDLSHEKISKLKPKALVTPFKRSELKSSLSSSNNNTAVPMSGWAALSGKASALSSQKSIDETSRPPDVKQDNSIKRISQKEKTKLPKNHSKNLLHGSDAWAEALGATSSTNDKVKSSIKVSSNNNSTKHLSLSSVPWLSTPGSNISAKQKTSSIATNSLISPKTAPFPKASALTGSVTKSASNHDSASKQVQMMRKKAAAKQQQKRARI